jgi:streptogramin lyase
MANAVGVTFLAPGWSATDFHTLTTPTRSIEFDSLGNLYIEDVTDDNSGLIEILKLDASSGYSTSSVFASYSTGYKGVTGLDFDGLGNLYVSERSVSGDAGIIRKVDVATKAVSDVMTFANHRPTGLDADTAGSVFYSGRKDSDGTWGKIFEIDSTSTRSELSSSTVATGMAVDAQGNFFISTPNRTDLALLANSVYRFDSGDFASPVLIASFDQRGGELTFDEAGSLYFVAEDGVSIVKLSAVPVPAAVWLFASGLAGLVGMARRKRA